MTSTSTDTTKSTMSDWLSGLTGFLGTAGSAYQATVNADANKKLADAQKQQANASLMSSENLKKAAIYGGGALILIGVIYFIAKK